MCTFHKPVLLLALLLVISACGGESRPDCAAFENDFLRRVRLEADKMVESAPPDMKAAARSIADGNIQMVEKNFITWCESLKSSELECVNDATMHDTEKCQRVHGRLFTP